MSEIISWGKCTIECAKSINGKPVGEWKRIATPKEDTTKITPTAGQQRDATIEGGEVIATYVGRNSYMLEFDTYVTAATKAPFDDQDGVVVGEYAFRITAENPKAPGALIERAVVRVETSYTSADGVIAHHVVRILKPAAGKQVKTIVPHGVPLDKYELNFASAADTTGKTIAATSRGNVTAESNCDWITASTSSKSVTIKVAANTTGERRVGHVIVSADDTASYVEVLQIPA